MTKKEKARQLIADNQQSFPAIQSIAKDRLEYWKNQLQTATDWNDFKRMMGHIEEVTYLLNIEKHLRVDAEFPT